MKFESAAVHTGEEVAAQPRNQNREGAETEGKERDQESAPVMETSLQQASIAATESLEGVLKTLLNSYQRISAGVMSGFRFLSTQKVFRHGRDDSPGEKIRRQHCEDDSFGERHKEVPCYPSQQEHRGKYDANCERGHEGGCRDLRRTIQHDLVHVFVWFCLTVPINVLDLDRGIVHQDADRQGESTKRHNIDRLPDRSEHNDGRQDRQRNRSRNDDGAAPTAQK